MTTIHIQPTFIKYATKKEVKRFNELSPAIQSKAWDLGATDAHVQKVPCGKDGFRYARVQFRCNGRYVGNMMV
jgi:hypothetical protein